MEKNKKNKRKKRKPSIIVWPIFLKYACTLRMAAAIPYMLDLRERWRGRCLSEMAEALREREGA